MEAPNPHQTLPRLQQAPINPTTRQIPWEFVEPESRKKELLDRLKDESQTDPLRLAAWLREMDMFHYSYVDTCKAISAIFGIFIRMGDRSADLLTACVSTLKGFCSEICVTGKVSLHRPAFLGVPDDELCRKLIRMLADPSLRSRADKDILCCVSLLVSHNALTARCVDIRPVFACIRFHLRWERNPFILSEGARLIRLLLERNFSITCLCDNRVGDILAQIFLSVSDAKAFDCVQSVVTLVIKSRRFRIRLFEMDCQKSMTKRLVKILKTSSTSNTKPGHLSAILKLTAIMIQGNPTFKPLLFSILPNIMAELGRYLNQSPCVVEDITRLYMYLARDPTPALAASLLSIIGPLLIIMFRYSSFKIGKVSCSILMELCSTSTAAKVCLLQHISEKDLYQVFPAHEANAIASVLHRPTRRN